MRNCSLVNQLVCPNIFDDVQKPRNGFQDFFEKGIEAFGLLKSANTLLFVVVLTFGFIAGQVLTNFFLFLASHLNLSFWVGLFLLLVIQVANMPPSVPGKNNCFRVRCNFGSFSIWHI